MTTSISDAGVMFADGNTQAAPQVPVRQTVLSGPVDTNGQSAFGGSTGGTTVTASGTLVMTSANGNTNRIGTKVNPSWTGLSTNGTMYLYADVNTNGTITEGVGTLAPIYQWGGTPANTSGLFTYNIQQNSGFIGTGSAATAGYRVYVGEVTVASGVVSAIVWYALMARYDSGFTATAPAIGSRTSKNHNLGIKPLDVDFILECTTADGGYAVGEQIGIDSQLSYDGSFIRPLALVRNTNTMSITIGNAATVIITNPTNGAGTAITNTSWKYKFKAFRGW